MNNCSESLYYFYMHIKPHIHVSGKTISLMGKKLVINLSTVYSLPHDVLDVGRVEEHSRRSTRLVHPSPYD